MNMNNTERGGEWTDAIEMEMRGGVKLRVRLNPMYFHPEVQRLENDGWVNGEKGDYDDVLARLYAERTAARDRDAKLAELVAKWRRQAAATLEYGRSCAYSFAADDLEALLTNPTAHVEADRQGDVMRQMYEALKEIAKGACTEYRCYDNRCRPGRLAKAAIEAYEALHGTEGVKG